MPRVPSPRNRAGNLLIAGGLLLGSVSLAGCGTPPELRDPPGSTLPPLVSPSPTNGSPAPTAPVTPVQPAATATGFAEYTVVDCAGKPSRQQVISLLRRTDGLLPRGANITVSLGPLCAGDWQYSVVRVPDHEPLQVVSQGPASTLELITAGTDVCNIPVRTSAPLGIRTAACEAAPTTSGGL